MNNVAKILDHFLSNDTPKQYNNYVTNGKVLLYVDGTKREREVIAIKFKDFIVGNSSTLRLVPKVIEGARRSSVRNETEVQRALAEKILMVPFEVFKQAGLNLEKFQLLAKGPQESLIRIESQYNREKGISEPIEIKQHFTGASLFKVDNEVFLFDVDRNELNHGIINPFLVKLAFKNIKTITEAYECLKPVIVKDAEKNNLKVERQGEWFFIPVNEFTAKRLEANVKFKKSITLQAGNNRPNYTQGLQINSDGSFVSQEMDRASGRSNGIDVASQSSFFVQGIVKHSGREHKDLELKSWHQAVPNTATTSWTITGDID